MTAVCHPVAHAPVRTQEWRHWRRITRRSLWLFVRRHGRLALWIWAGTVYVLALLELGRLIAALQGGIW